MKKLYVLRGVPGSGKSTFIRQHHLDPYTISTDQLRLLISNLCLIYDPTQKRMRQAISQEYNAETFSLLDRLIRNKMMRGETVIVDGTHLYPNAFDNYLKYQQEYHYDVIVVDFTHTLSLGELLQRNQSRIDYRYIDPSIIKKIYQYARSHPRLPRWLKQITPDQFEKTLYLEETDLSSYRSIAIIGADATFRGNLKPHEFYFSFNHDFAVEHQTSHHVAYISHDLSTLNEKNAYTVFPFKFRNKHYLVNSYLLRDDFIGATKVLYGHRFYKFGLLNPADFMRELPAPHADHNQITMNSFPQHQINRLA